MIVMKWVEKINDNNDYNCKEMIFEMMILILTMMMILIIIINKRSSDDNSYHNHSNR